MHAPVLTPAQFALINDIAGDEAQQHLPVGEAMRLTMAILRKDSDAIRSISCDYADAGWACFMRTSTNYEAAESWKLAYSYADTALKLFDL